MIRPRPAWLACGLLLVLAAAWWTLWRPAPAAVELWCAHDAIYADEVLAAFTAATGIPVVVRYDSEATKTLGLVERLQREGGRDCDVFWNNELLGTLALATAGKLEAYRGSAWNRAPATARDADGLWTGFGARLRVIAVHPPQLTASEAAVTAAWRGDLARAAMAKPIYGTTLTQSAVLWQVLGEAGFAAWYEGALGRGLRLTDGNSSSRDLVAAGTVALGLTDTDDACAAVVEGKPLAMLPLRLGLIADVPPALATRTIAIPNTVAILAGCRHPGPARQLADFIASAATELTLARSAAQVPLGPVDDALLPPAIRPLRAWAADAIDLRALLPARDACLAWLKKRLGQ